MILFPQAQLILLVKVELEVCTLGFLLDCSKHLVIRHKKQKNVIFKTRSLDQNRINIQSCEWGLSHMFLHPWSRSRMRSSGDQLMKDKGEQ